MDTAHTCQSIVITCMDFRFQKYIEQWLAGNVGEKQYDRVAWAGGVFDLDGIMKQIDISTRLHHIKNVVLINHEDCGAYGQAGTKERHRADLRKAKKKVLSVHPDLAVDLCYVYLDGTFESL